MHQWWNVTKYLYSTHCTELQIRGTLLDYFFNLTVLLLHLITDGNIVLYSPVHLSEILDFYIQIR